MKRGTLIALFLLMLPVLLGSGSAFRPEVIRVAISRGAETLRVDGKGVLITDVSGEPLRLSVPLVVKRVKDGISVNGRFVKGVTISAPVSISLNGKGYRGTMEILPAEHGLLAVNELPLEDYLVGLINCEISSQWPMEAIKAQAVIARTYALYQKDVRLNALYHLESSVMDQVYDGCDIEDSRATRGVRETAGEVLTYNNAIIQAFYHSNCGGHTEAAENVWGSAYLYLQGVECKYCLTAPNAKWEQTIPLVKIEAQLKNVGYQVSGLRDIRVGRRNKSGRVGDLTLTARSGPAVISAVTFRKALGYGVIKSTNMDVRMDGDSVAFSGIGYGHGVGLCQWGAKQRGSDGFDYREILSYYYPGTLLEKVNRKS